MEKNNEFDYEEYEFIQRAIQRIYEMERKEEEEKEKCEKEKRKKFRNSRRKEELCNNNSTNFNTINIDEKEMNKKIVFNDNDGAANANTNDRHKRKRKEKIDQIEQTTKQIKKLGEQEINQRTIEIDEINSDNVCDDKYDVNMNINSNSDNEEEEEEETTYEEEDDDDNYNDDNNDEEEKGKIDTCILNPIEEEMKRNNHILLIIKCSVCWEYRSDLKTINRCGHHFCNKCLNGIKVIGHNIKTDTKICKCPICNGNFDSDMDLRPHFDGKQLSEEIIVKCPGRKCKWIGKYMNLEEHMKTNCRTVFFCYCESFFHKKYEKLHKQSCLYAKEYKCSCGQIMKYIEKDEHFKICLGTEVECKSKKLGCTWKGPRRMMKQHWKFECGYGVLIRENSELKKKLDNLEKNFGFWRNFSDTPLSYTFGIVENINITTTNSISITNSNKKRNEFIMRFIKTENNIKCYPGEKYFIVNPKYHNLKIIDIKTDEDFAMDFSKLSMSIDRKDNNEENGESCRLEMLTTMDRFKVFIITLENGKDRFFIFPPPSSSPQPQSQSQSQSQTHSQPQSQPQSQLQQLQQLSLSSCSQLFSKDPANNIIITIKNEENNNNKKILRINIKLPKPSNDRWNISNMFYAFRRWEEWADGTTIPYVIQPNEIYFLGFSLIYFEENEEKQKKLIKKLIKFFNLKKK